VKLDLPEGETISRSEYDRKIVVPIRQMLQQQNLHKRVRVLVTVYGVPLHVGPSDFTTAERTLRRDAAERLEAARTHLVEVEQQVRALVVPSDGGGAPGSDQNQNLPTYERNMGTVFRLDRVVLSSLEWARQHSPMNPQVYAKLEFLFRRYKGLAGVAELHHEVPSSVQGSDSTHEERRAQQREGLQLLVGSLELPVRQNRDDLYRRIELVYGQHGGFCAGGDGIGTAFR
jgi:hypothetical protein